MAESLQLGPRSAGSFGEANPRTAGVADSSSLGGFQSRPPVSDIKKPSSVADADIPIIGEDEPVSAGVEEDEVKISEKDLPF